jgi:CBS-domain-containing membrane protein
MKRAMLALCATALLITTPNWASAQRPGRRQPPEQRQLPPAARDQTADTGGRARMERQVRQNFARLVRQGVGLSEEQMGRLVPVTQRFEQQRRQLQMDERDARMGLRQMMRDEKTANPQQVDRLLQTLVDVQKRRALLLEAEQRELAGIMTPVQRAKFMAIQDQVRRRLEQMRQRRVP